MPDLRDQKYIAIDLETYDPNLRMKGAGYVHGDGHILGIAIGVPDGRRWYIPIGGMGGGFTKNRLRMWCEDNLTTGATIVGANLMYDMGWLRSYRCPFTPPFFDVQFAEALIDEHRRVYNLDSIATKYLGEQKKSDELYEWLAEHCGGKPNEKQRANIYKAPIELVSEYAKGDVDLPLRIMKKQIPIIVDEGLGEVTKLEHDLIPLLLDMKFRGVRIDEDKLHSCRSFFDDGLEQAQEALDKLAGFHVNTSGSTDLVRVFESRGVAYSKTANGNPSFTKQSLEACVDEVAQHVLTVRGYGKMKTTFVDGYMSFLHNGRIHADFHPLRSDEGGTVSGRFSSSKPNLQNIPSRHPTFAPMLRGLFIPEDGEQWAKIDYSSVEYRMLVHYAIGDGADAVRDMFKKDPDTDFHQVVADMAGMSRRNAKNLNFAQLYGQGKKATAATLGCSIQESEEFKRKYHRMAPYIDSTRVAVQSAALRRGYLKGYAGRRHRFPYWEPADWDLSVELGRFKDMGECVIAVDGRCGVKRAQMHKTMNALFQGSSADIMKMAMVKIHKSGVLDVLGTPLLTVHDELDFSVGTSSMEALLEVKRLMEDFDLKVPLVADIDIGDNWGDLHTLQK